MLYIFCSFIQFKYWNIICLLCCITPLQNTVSFSTWRTSETQHASNIPLLWKSLYRQAVIFSQGLICGHLSSLVRPNHFNARNGLVMEGVEKGAFDGIVTTSLATETPVEFPTNALE